MMHRDPPLRRTALVLAVAAALTVPTLACAADAQGKRRASHWHGYGFEPGYVPPEQIDALPALVWLPRFLQRATEWRRLRLLPDRDTHRKHVELRVDIPGDLAHKLDAIAALAG
jgi:hypothetical protein